MQQSIVCVACNGGGKDRDVWKNTGRMVDCKYCAGRGYVHPPERPLWIRLGSHS